MDARAKRIAWISGGILALAALGGSLAHVAGAGASSHAPLPADKQARLDAEAARRAGGSRADKPADPGSQRPPSTAPAWELGVVEDDESPLRDYEVRNRWAGILDGKTVVVFAGFKAGQPGAGAVVVCVATADGTFSSMSPVDAPAGSGALRITGAQGSILSLTGASGGTLHFDAVAQHFV